MFDMLIDGLLYFIKLLHGFSAVKKLLQQRNSTLVESKKTDGYNSLHLAVVNAHLQITWMLIEVVSINYLS